MFLFPSSQATFLPLSERLLARLPELVFGLCVLCHVALWGSDTRCVTSCSQALGKGDLGGGATGTYTFEEFLLVVVGTGVHAPLVLGGNLDHGRVLAGQGLGVQALLEGLVPQLLLLSLLQLLQL